MTTQEKIIAIQKAIEMADKLESGLKPEAFEVPFLGSLKIRALLNNLGAISYNVMDIGCHKSGSLCSMLYGNSKINSATAIDSWASDQINEDKAYPIFEQYVNRFRPAGTELNVIVSDCWEVDLSLITRKIDLYSYDAGHERWEQRDALLYYKDVLADEFIFVCDDWQYGEVKEGTLEGIKQGGYEILFQQELLNPEPYTEDQHLNSNWWRGYAVFLLKK